MAKKEQSAELDTLVAERTTVREEIAALDADAEIGKLDRKLAGLRLKRTADLATASELIAFDETRAMLIQRQRHVAITRPALDRREKVLVEKIRAGAQAAYGADIEVSRAEALAQFAGAQQALTATDARRLEIAGRYGVPIVDVALAIALRAVEKAAAALKEAPGLNAVEVADRIGKTRLRQLEISLAPALGP